MESRRIGQFRRHFYLVFTEYFANHADLKDKKFELSTVRGTMYIDVDDDILGIVQFPRDATKERHAVVPKYDNLARYGMNKAKADELIAKAMAAANAH